MQCVLSPGRDDQVTTAVMQIGVPSLEQITGSVIPKSVKSVAQPIRCTIANYRTFLLARVPNLVCVLFQQAGSIPRD
jgi:hypothetical protein